MIFSSFLFNRDRPISLNFIKYIIYQWQIIFKYKRGEKLRKNYLPNDIITINLVLAYIDYCYRY